MIIDLLIIGIFVWEMYRGWKKGALYSLGVVALLGVAFILAGMFSEPLALRLYHAAEERGTVRKIETELHKDVSFGIGVEESLDRIGIPQSYREILKKDENIMRKIEEIARDASEAGQEQLQAAAKDLARNLISLGTRIISFLLILFVSFYLMRLILRLISEGLNKVPVLGVLNRGLGMAVGFMVALVLCGTILSLLPGAGKSFPEIYSQLEQSRLASFVHESSLYKGFLEIVYH